MTRHAEIAALVAGLLAALGAALLVGCWRAWGQATDPAWLYWPQEVN